MTNPNNQPPAATVIKPPPVIPGTPQNYTVDAGKTFVLVSSDNKVCLIQDCTKQTRLFTQWEVHEYPDNATAMNDIKTKGWSYTPPKTAN